MTVTIMSDEAKQQFKDKMNGLKLNKPINLEQARWIVRALEKQRFDLMSCLYPKKKSVDNKKIEAQLEQFKGYWVGPRNSGWQESKKALLSLDLSPGEFTEVLRGIGREADWRASQKRGGKFLPEWKHPATWLRSRRWEAEFACEKSAIEKSPGMTAADATAKILEKIDIDSNNRVVKSFKEQLSDAQKKK